MITYTQIVNEMLHRNEESVNFRRRGNLGDRIMQAASQIKCVYKFKHDSDDCQ